MKSFLETFLDPADKQLIDNKHQIEKIRYGVYQPPSLKELISLRYLLLSTGSFKEVHCEELLGLSKIECRAVLKKLKNIHTSQIRNQVLNEVKSFDQ